MKKAKHQSEFTTLEHLSLTLTQINQDASGKQTINRTYWSTRKKINQPDKKTDNLMLKDSQIAAKKVYSDAKKDENPVKGFIQMSLFLISKQ
jgi:hypothetical protein